MAHFGITSCIHLNYYLVGEVNTKMEMVANNWFNFFLLFFFFKQVEVLFIHDLDFSGE